MIQKKSSLSNVTVNFCALFYPCSCNKIGLLWIRGDRTWTGLIQCSSMSFYLYKIMIKSGYKLDKVSFYAKIWITRVLSRNLNKIWIKLLKLPFPHFIQICTHFIQNYINFIQIYPNFIQIYPHFILILSGWNLAKRTWTGLIQCSSNSAVHFYYLLWELIPFW